MGKLATKLLSVSEFAVVGLFVLHFTLLVISRFTAWPEMTLWPYLMLNGWKPYTDIAIAHTPLVLFDLTIFFRLFGIGITQLKIYTWVFVLLTDVILYWVVAKLSSQKKALISLAFFILLSLIFEINGLWFDLTLAPLALLLFYLLKSKNFLWAGIVWTLAFFAKQTAFWLLIPTGIYLFLECKKDLKKLWLMADYMLLGFLCTLLLILLVLAVMGVLPSFLAWAINFGVFYLPHAAGQVALPTIRQFLVGLSPFIILLPYLYLARKKTDWVLVGFAIFGALGVLPRWGLFHFIPALPFLAIITSEVFLMARGKKDKKLIYRGVNLVKTFIVIYCTGILILFGKYLSRNLTWQVRFFEPSVQEVVFNVKSEAKDKTIFILNYWDSVYAYSQSLPVVKPWVPYLPWYQEYKGLKDEILIKLKEASPDVILVGEFQDTGLGAYQQPDLVDYITRYYYLEKTVGGVGFYYKNR